MPDTKDKVVNYNIEVTFTALNITRPVIKQYEFEFISLLAIIIKAAF